MSLSRRLAVACGAAALLATAACGGSDDSPPPGDIGDKITEQDAGQDAETDAGEDSDQQPDEAAGAAGFDECGLHEPAELAAQVGVEALYITAREVRPRASEGGRLAGCSYLTEDVPGITGMTVNTVVGTDAEAFFRPFGEREVRPVDKLGDRAEVVAYETPNGSLHFRELRVVEGDIGLHLRYTYNESPGGMPALDDDALAELMAFVANTGLERLPEQVTIADGAPEGPCAAIDVGQASQVLGGELTTARSVRGANGALSCSFSGDEAALEVAVIADPARVQSMGVPAEAVNAPDLGDGARLLIQPNEEAQGPLDATVNLGSHLVLVTGSYGPDAGSVAAPRPEDVELVRAITAVVSP
jgi:hypothetical protein